MANNKKIACGCDMDPEDELGQVEPAIVEVEMDEDPNEVIAKALMEVAAILAEDESPIEELEEEIGIGEEAIPNQEEVESAISNMLETMDMDEAEEIADHNMALWRGVHHRLNEMKGITAAEKKNNPYAICTESVGREDEAKYKRCKEDVEKKQASLADKIASDFLKK